jgi:phosphotransferase family enzyme
VWLPDLADTARMSQLLVGHVASFGLPVGTVAIELLDVRLTHPHRPDSPLCRGWATYLVTPPDEAPELLYVKGFPDRATAEAAWRQDRRSRPEGRSSHLADHDLVVWRFPEDPLLPALPQLLAAGRAPDVVPTAVRAVLDPRHEEEPRVTVVRYQPEASATLRFVGGVDGGPAVFAKHLAGNAVLDHAARHEALWSLTGPGQPLRVAEPLAADPVRGVMWARGVPGVPLTAAVTPVDLPALTKTVGALLAALHASSVPTSQTVTVDTLVAEMRKKAQKLAAADAAVAPIVSRLVDDAVRHHREAARERICPLHGDFHLDQLVSSAEGPVLVDLDSMVRGTPEIDLAEFLVDLALRGWAPTVTERVADSLLVSYQEASATPIDLVLLAVCADAEFVNRCYRQLRRHTPGWQGALHEELGRHDQVKRLLVY